MTHSTPEKAHGSPVEAPAASDTPQGPRLHVTSALGRPETGQGSQERRAAALKALGEMEDQDAREVERRGRWEALWSARVREAEAQRDALQRDLAQAVSERDRLWAGIERFVAYGLTGYDLTPTTTTHVSQQWLYQYLAEVDAAWRQRLHALATPDADAQDEGVQR